MAQVQNAWTGFRNTVKIGDWVSFKADVEQVGKIKSIRGPELVLVNDGGFQGGYIGGQTETTEFAERCWTE
jgi:hypothetical protein